MLEILHDVAPNAELGFATAFNSDASFADNIRALRFEAGCDVIVDDVLYFNEHPFQDGPIAQSVNAVTADGALFFSSAGNEGNTLDGTAANYEGDFVDSGRGVGKFAGAAHDFDPGPGVQVFEPISPQSSADVPVTLFWADPLGRRRQRLRPVPVRRELERRAFSQDVQDGNDDPYEMPRHAAARRHRPAARGREVPRRGPLLPAQRAARPLRELRRRAGRLHHAGRDARPRGRGRRVRHRRRAGGRCRSDLLEPGDPPNPVGPFPNPFTSAQLPERFTSDGPRRVFFHPDGTPITPGDFSSTGGTVRLKPDITAADGVNTSVDDFAPFFGTSAAAPHAAAIAGLVLSGNPGSRPPTCARRSPPPRSTWRRRASTSAPAPGSCAPTTCSTTPAPRRSRSCGRARRPSRRSPATATPTSSRARRRTSRCR